jgi:predicted metal-binding membrane protein
MSMAWMRMPGQTWPGAAASFLVMWVVMMAAMMLPSLVPMLWRYRQAVGRTASEAAASCAGAARKRDATTLGWLTALVGVGYFFVWSVFGMGAFLMGATIAAVEMQRPELARAVPLAAGVIVLIAGSLQLTAWKARHLVCCREVSASARGGGSAGNGETSPKRSQAADAGSGGGTLRADAGTAWRHGLRLGLHCTQCCAGLMAILLVIGVMDLRAMTIVAAAITVERLAPSGERIARAIGALVSAAGLLLIVRAAGLG